MAFVIGTDEAGYGPNLGPLVIGGTAWHIQDDNQDLDLYRRLLATVTKSPGSRTTTSQFVVADSKKLYQPRKGLHRLERALFPSLQATGKQPRRWQQLWCDLSSESKTVRHSIPWYRHFDIDVPVDCESDEISNLHDSFQRTCCHGGVQLAAISSSVVFPKQFNRLVFKLGKKSTLLSLTTLELIKTLMAQSGWSDSSESLYVFCDKHGGRNRYGAMLQQVFPEYLVEVHGESSAASIYRWGPTNQRVEISFQARGESNLATALASITAKYLRETAMMAFNHFWKAQVPDLKPTAGYPTDARRFLEQIESTQQKLGIDKDDLWRQR